MKAKMPALAIAIMEKSKKGESKSEDEKKEYGAIDDAAAMLLSSIQEEDSSGIAIALKRAFNACHKGDEEE